MVINFENEKQRYLYQLMEKRHSVRSYLDNQVEEDKKSEINKIVSEINHDHGFNFQVFYDEPECFDCFMAHYGKFNNVKNYLSLVASKEDEEKVGYYAEMIVLKMIELGLSSCYVALTHGKSKAKVSKNQKEICIICFGYGKTEGVFHKNKELSKLSNVDEKMPTWFKNGVLAAILAPTATNQQKFYISYENDKAYIKKKIGFYSTLDLGIVKYHFETISGHKIINKE